MFDQIFVAFIAFANLNTIEIDLKNSLSFENVVVPFVASIALISFF